MQNLDHHSQSHLSKLSKNTLPDVKFVRSSGNITVVTSNGPPPPPQIEINAVETHVHPSNRPGSYTLESTTYSLTLPSQFLTLPLQSLSAGKEGSVRDSVTSFTTSYNSLYSLVSGNTEDLDLQSIRLQLDKVGEQKSSKLDRFKRLVKRKDKNLPELDEDAKFLAYVCQKLQTSYYFYERTSTLNVPWREAAEVFFFGDPLDKLFQSQHSILGYVLQSSLELGQPRFSNFNKFHVHMNVTISDLITQLLPSLDHFNEMLDLYAMSEANIARPELFELFSGFANICEGLSIPLAISMFGRWLLAYSRDSAVESNYENTVILNYFRKAARLALAIEKVKPLFVDYLEQTTKLDENTKLDKIKNLALARYFNKDNNNALSIALQTLGEYYQYEHNHHLSVTMWELNCQLSHDSESGNLAILGLTNGYGFGNHIKEHNRIGRRSKTDKFNTKRRIAHLYRILMKQPGFGEYGVSWADKSKYD